MKGETERLSLKSRALNDIWETEKPGAWSSGTAVTSSQLWTRSLPLLWRDPRAYWHVLKLSPELRPGIPERGLIRILVSLEKRLVSIKFPTWPNSFSVGLKRFKIPPEWFKGLQIWSADCFWLAFSEVQPMENNPGEFIYRSPFGSHLNPEDRAQRSSSVVQRGSQSHTFNFPPFHCHVVKNWQLPLACRTDEPCFGSSWGDLPPRDHPCLSLQV